ncbi:MAG TPA: hypothetical protein VNO52_16520 [Methylomirabilota bacterium]|nr:hypothetical protein [Methylomirabilota bacterium]
MILLRHDCLVFRTGDGQNVPCSVEAVTVELLGEAASLIEPHVIRNAALAVLHYFKSELGRTTVSVTEFSKALEVALKSLGLDVASGHPWPGPVRVIDADLACLVPNGDENLEMAFFQRLRDELRRHLAKSPDVLRLRGLRHCVQRLVGAKRWNPRCQRLHDQAVDYVRRCLRAEKPQPDHALLVLR